jgi:hypothetical protein
VRALAERLRALVRREAPRAVEAVRPGWGALTFRDPRVGYCVGIFPLPDGVRLGFEWGVLLPDPAGLLVAGGAQFRAADLPVDAPVPVEALTALVRAALALPPEAAVRRELARQARAALR